MHKNNFDFLRLVFAIFVIITHSYALTGADWADPLSKLTGEQLNFSALGVKGFFIISGYLIFQSAMRCRNWGDYMVRRVLRIYPAFIMVLIIAVIVGLVVTSITAQEYLGNSATYTYITRHIAMFLPTVDALPGVFEHNPYKNAVNGSLWTIPYEFLFYIILSSAFLIRKNAKLLTALVILVFIATWLFTIRYEDTGLAMPGIGKDWERLAHLGMFFCAGSILAALNIGSFKYRNVLAMVSVVLVVIALVAKLFYFSQYIILPLAVILLGIMNTKGISGLSNKIGDWSYGIYLYGFLVQQTVVNYYKCTALRLMLIAIPVSMLIGALSWHLLEKRALKLKKYFP